MKRTRKLYGIAFCMIILIVGVIDKSLIIDAAKKIELNKKTLTLYEGTSYQLKLVNNSREVTWKTGNSKVATVSSDGKIKALKSGKTKITAVVKSKKFTCIVNVKKLDLETKYNELIKKTRAAGVSSVDKVVYYDLDGNGLDELLIYGVNLNDAGAASSAYTIIFCFYNGKMYESSVIGQRLTFVGNKKIVTEREYSSTLESNVFEMKKGVFKKTYTSSAFLASEPPHCTINGDEVSYEKYKKSYQKKISKLLDQKKAKTIIE